MPDTQNRILLRRPDVERVTGMSCSTIYDWIRAGKFPEPVRLSPRCSAWVAAEVDAWIAERIAASRKAAA